MLLKYSEVENDHYIDELLDSYINNIYIEIKV